LAANNILAPDIGAIKCKTWGSQ